MRYVAACFLSALPAVAQEPIARISISGPEAVRRTILPTNVGSLLSGKECQAIWQMFRGELRGMLTGVFGDTREAEALEQVERRILGYQGQIDVELFLDPAPGGGEPNLEGHLILWADGATEIGALTTELANTLDERFEGVAQDLAIGDETFRVVTQPGAPGISLPTILRDDHAVLFFGTDIERAVEHGRSRLATGFEPRAERVARHKRSELLTIEVDLARVIASLDDVDADRKGLEGRMMAYDTWRDLRIAVGASGPNLQLEIAAGFGDGHRGLYEAFLPDIGQLPRLLDRVPTRTEERVAFVAGHVDWLALYGCVLDFAANFTLFGGEPREIDAVKADANEEAGFDVEKELIGSVATDVLLVFETEAAEPGEVTDEIDGFCMAWRVTDPATFAKVFATFRERENNGWEQLAHGDVTIHRAQGNSRSPLHLAHHGDLFVAGFGPRGRETLERVLDTRPAEDGKRPTRIRQVQRNAPPGWNLAGSIPTTFTTESFALGIFWELWRELRGALPGRVGRGVTRKDFRGIVERLGPVLAEYKLDHVAWLGGYEDGTARIRVLW